MIKVYTANIGNYEKFRDDIEVYTNPIMNDNKKSSLFYKTLTPDFEKYEYSIWIDGNTSLKVDPSFLIDKYLCNHDIVCLKHSIRNCLYKESEECKTLQLDSSLIIDEQMKRYEAYRYSHKNGLSATTYILRRHTPNIERFNQLWWAEICKGSKRDQLSFDYCLWKLNIKVRWFDVDNYNNHIDNPYFNYLPHGS